MARMHTKKHGRSKSRKPEATEATPSKKSEEDIKKVIKEYMDKGIGAATIGQNLKEKHEVPYIKHAMGKRLTAVMKEQGYKQEFPEDMLNLMKRAVNLRKHIEKNNKDMHNKTRLIRVESKIWRLTRYYKREGMLSPTWKYDPVQAALVVKG